eukprot:Skav233073  [mRNA]  locus=scaffold1468:225355:232915:- [translate_table: standard]
MTGEALVKQDTGFRQALHAFVPGSRLSREDAAQLQQRLEALSGELRLGADQGFGRSCRAESLGEGWHSADWAQRLKDVLCDSLGEDSSGSRGSLWLKLPESPTLQGTQSCLKVGPAMSSERSHRWLGLAAAAGAAGAAAGAWWLWRQRRTRQVKVAALYVYPVKSCRGHSLAKVKVTKWGLENDRTDMDHQGVVTSETWIYMVVDEKNEFVTQRQDLPTSRGITLRVADGSLAPLHVFLDETSPPKNVKVWDDWVQAVDQGNSAAEWLSTVLQMPKLRLAPGLRCSHQGFRAPGALEVRICSSAQRATDPKYGLGETAFSDGFPVLVSSTASVARLARQAWWRVDFFSESKREKEVYFGQNALCEFLGTSSFEITVGDVATVEW